MVPAAVVDETIADLLPHARGGRHRHRRRQFLLRGRYPAGEGTRAEGHPLRGRGHERRRLGPGARLLHDDRRRAGRGAGTSTRSSPRSRPARATSRAPRDANRPAAPPSRAICTAGRTAPGTSSRWCTTASSTASWPPTPRAWASCAPPTSASRSMQIDAETTPLRDPEHYQYDLNLADIAEVWRRGSVIASWLLDLTATRAARGSRRSRSSRGACPIPARAAGRSRPPSTRRCRRRCSPRRSTSASARAARRISRTGCSRRCATSSAGTWKNPGK